ncbi:SDR family NAD(P)-dependent oxidoreductase [Dorea sp. YH-dor226]|uniref:elongation factor P 5-aminopentanone reductase n=1 Tax=Dorea sp. YH-dor226 TaxID=3151119 RepID=UPI00324232F0
MNRKTVFITGASRGIGKSAAILFASKGYHTFLNCASSLEALENVKETIETRFQVPCTLVPGDVGNPENVAQIYTQIYQQCDHLDVLVNNAGISYIGLLTDMSIEEWEHVIHTNLSSVFYCCREAILPMVSQKSGKIINISSMWGTSGASCEVAYSAAKSGVNGFTRALAKELAPSNIQVNAIACGVIDTDMNRQLSAREREALEEEIPAGRYGTPDEIAQIIWDIANAPAYMTGQIIGVDGGYL